MYFALQAMLKVPSRAKKNATPSLDTPLHYLQCKGLIHGIKNAIFTNHCTNWGRGPFQVQS